VAPEPNLSNEAASATLQLLIMKIFSAWLRAMPKAVRFATIAHQMQQSDSKQFIYYICNKH
jgi:hypothetical protein